LIKIKTNSPLGPLLFLEKIREVVSAVRGSGYVNEAVGNEGRALEFVPLSAE
jgi:hypothetical protein